MVGSTAVSTRIEGHQSEPTLPTLKIYPHTGIIYARFGERVRFSCIAQGDPTPNVVWIKSTANDTINSPFLPKVSSQASAAYEIASMSNYDEGLYTCTATNAAGTYEDRVEVRIKHDVSVNPKDSLSDANFKIDNNSIIIEVGENVSIPCDDSETRNSQIHLDWMRGDRQPLLEGSVVRDGLLTISNTTKAVNGAYVCRGLNGDGSEIFRKIINLEVIIPLRIELNPVLQRVNAGENFALVCTATGDEPINIVWKRIGHPLPHSANDYRGTLLFRGILYDDAGKYVCKATNNFGTVETTTEILVGAP